MFNKQHDTLTTKYPWYAKWHSVPKVSLLHMLVLAVFMAGMGLPFAQSLNQLSDELSASARSAKDTGGRGGGKGGSKNVVATTTTTTTATTTTIVTTATTTTDTAVVVETTETVVTPTGTTTTTTATTSTATSTSVTTTITQNDTYYSTLVNGYLPKDGNQWGGRSWRFNGGPTWVYGMDHSMRQSSQKNKVRFEIRNTDNDKASGDETGKRRSEFSGTAHKLPNDTELWGAMSFIHEAWADPAGMALLFGGVYGQIHMGNTFGGSPAVAFRRHKSGDLQITTRGENDSSGSGTARYRAPLSFNEPHDLVYKMVLSPTNGSLVVWLDGKKIVDVSGVSIGSRYAESYLAFGTYFAGGITTPVAAQYASVVYPSTASLQDRVTNRPAWPAY